MITIKQYNEYLTKFDRIKKLESTARSYTNEINKIGSYFNVDLYTLTSKDLTKFREEVFFPSDWGQKNIIRGKGSNRAALNALIRTAKHFEEGNHTKDIIEDKSIVIEAKNIIYFGVPGSGKSYTVSVNYRNDENANRHITTVFHPEYTNSDFVGQIIHVIKEGNIEYQFNPGPFTIALEMALKDKFNYYSLIIEEINRGNASAIFGEIFQLLDRNEIGSSVYEKHNVHLQQYLELHSISIPSNLNIIATMNTSDQNVFVLDTAFKRRWNMKRIPNKFENTHPYKNQIIPEPDLSSQITWQEFVVNVNKKIMDSESLVDKAEDLQLGVYFIEEDMLVSPDTKSSIEAITMFAEKVIMYLWEDVSKLNNASLFIDNIKSLDDVIDQYIELGIKIFEETFD